MLQYRVDSQTLLLSRHIPNKALTIVGLIIFGLSATYLTAHVNLSKSARFLYILHLTVLMECIGYLIRRNMCSNFTDHGRYVRMTLFLLLTPDSLALVNYKEVGEIIRLSNVQTNRRPKFFIWFFFSSDLFSFFLLQGAGDELQSSPGSNSNCTAITFV